MKILHNCVKKRNLTRGSIVDRWLLLVVSLANSRKNLIDNSFYGELMKIAKIAKNTKYKKMLLI
jgi:hypothetical protein